MAAVLLLQKRAPAMARLTVDPGGNVGLFLVLLLEGNGTRQARYWAVRTDDTSQGQVEEERSIYRGEWKYVLIDVTFAPSFVTRVCRRRVPLDTLWVLKWSTKCQAS